MYSGKSPDSGPTKYKLIRKNPIFNIYMKIIKGCQPNQEGFLLNMKTGESFSLNAVALDVLSFLKEEHTEEELFDFMRNHYEVDETALRADLSDFCFLLKQKKIIE